MEASPFLVSALVLFATFSLLPTASGPLAADAGVSQVSWDPEDLVLAANATKAYVQVSGNGVDWTNVATVNATDGVPRSFDVTLPGTNAAFVRLFPEYHANFDPYATLAPNRPPRGFFLDSRVTLEGAGLDVSAA